MEKAPFLFISKGVKGGRLEIHFGTFWKKTAKTDNFMLLIADYIPAKKREKPALLEYRLSSCNRGSEQTQAAVARILCPMTISHSKSGAY